MINRPEDHNQHTVKNLDVWNQCLLSLLSPIIREIRQRAQVNLTVCLLFLFYLYEHWCLEENREWILVWVGLFGLCLAWTLGRVSAGREYITLHGWAEMSLCAPGAFLPIA